MASIPIRYDRLPISNGARDRGERRVVGFITRNTLGRDAADAEATPEDRHIAALTGIDVGDVAVFRATCLECALLIIVRLPGRAANRAARLGIGAEAKPENAKAMKVGDDVVSAGGRFYVGDYDVMSVWQRVGSAYEKIPFTRDQSGAWTEVNAERLFARLNGDLTLKLQHGANDDWDTQGRADYDAIKVRAVSGHARFAAFTESGAWRLLTSPGSLRAFYTAHGLAWPYP